MPLPRRRQAVLLSSLAAAAVLAVVLPRLAGSAADDPQPKAYAELKDVMWTVNQGPTGVVAVTRDAFNKGTLEDDDWAAQKGRTAMICEVTNWMLKAKPPVNGDTPEGLAKWKKHIADYRTDAEAARDAAVKKDCAAGKAAMASLGKRCNECHADHRKDE